MRHSKLLLKKFSQFATDFILFTDEKVFTVTLPTKRLNDHVYAASDTRKCSTVLYGFCSKFYTLSNRKGIFKIS